NYLSAIPYREKIKNSLTKLWNYERYSSPFKVGDYYDFSKNDGLQEQSVYYIQKGLDAAPEVLIDPNKLSSDGSVSLAGLYFSNDNNYFSYGISKGGSDWNEFFVVDLESKIPTEDHIVWSKFSGSAWYKDGFFYGRYDEPKPGEELKATNEFKKLYYHKVCSPQSDDILILEDKDHPKYGFGAGVSDDQKYLIISVSEGSTSNNLIYYKNLETDSEIIKLIDKFTGNYSFIDNKDDKFYLETNDGAPNNKIILIDLKNPSKENWKTIIPETKEVIKSVSRLNNKFIVTYLKDAYSQVKVFDDNGKFLYDIELPAIGNVSGFSGKNDDTETFYTFTSFNFAPTIYKYSIIDNKSELFRKTNLPIDTDNFEVKQVFYPSKDGTKIPMFLVYKKGLVLDGNNPTLLYAYGGFNIAMQPSFSVARLALLNSGVVYAMANLRGGSEYGEDWHKAGMLEKKQNVFDDFISAAEYLVKEKYTNPSKLAIQGGSNGGLLVGAVINQRPDLFKVAFPAVGVMDMLRFHKFTIGWAWVTEYGSSDVKDQFDYLIKYSPLHTIKKGVDYPAVLITTADHDDRVFPAHSFKYAAELQNSASDKNPKLIRIETKVGHGAGTSTSKSIELNADIFSFLFYNLGVTPVLD
ncbi:MAG: prolyl oligopeptidase family serine peptidase, partial [Ignavibacteriaceae bacterium]|nr:prolyl oligopeptidase family serine peptidase [Ignavibacteriaceae bacterium]